MAAPVRPRRLELPVRNPFSSSRPSADQSATRETLRPADGSSSSLIDGPYAPPMEPNPRGGYISVGPDGHVTDSIYAPVWPDPPVLLEARYESGNSRSMSRSDVPFAPVTRYALSPRGYARPCSGW
jgi:hypothetical protein